MQPKKVYVILRRSVPLRVNAVTFIILLVAPHHYTYHC